MTPCSVVLARDSAIFDRAVRLITGEFAVSSKLMFSVI
jgi:hypothetical protein